MKYTSRQYAQAFFEIYKDKPAAKRKTVLRNFLSILQKKRDWPRLGLILKEVERLNLQAEGLKKVEVETASPSKTLRGELEAILGEKLFIKERVNPDILAGIKILINDEILIDASAGYQLERMLMKR